MGRAATARFDVEERRHSRAFHHYTLGDELNVEQEEVLEWEVIRVTCRWCGSSTTIQTIAADDPDMG
ncbi:MAG: hypothetical protein ACRDJ4_10625 [Actinomycetota bacterium]